ncbi:MAG: class I SAM-dependent methyltransferase [Eubacteriaceae bacterium]|jgi:tRNA (adenine22-N1)-methyltransferase|nr:class I SAM-dependent methyltransferase [Eubacteriaceae bacterium]
MVELTNRLKTMALEIYSGETMADIGTDHGFLPIFLKQCGMCPKVILTDLSEGSLQKARDNAAAAAPDLEFDFRLGSGLEVIGEEEVDDIVIAGMGSELMIDMFEKDLHKTKTFKKFILQPRSKTGVLRHWLDSNGFAIAQESLVEEGPRICVIITAVPLVYEGEDKEGAERTASSYGEITAVPEEITEGFSEPVRLKEEPADSVKWDMPYWTQDSEDELTEEYIRRKLAQENTRLAGLSQGRVVDAAEFEKVRNGIRYLKELLDPFYDD